jgi:hypothetical protein
MLANPSTKALGRQRPHRCPRRGLEGCDRPPTPQGPRGVHATGTRRAQDERAPLKPVTSVTASLRTSLAAGCPRGHVTRAVSCPRPGRGWGVGDSTRGKAGLHPKMGGDAFPTACPLFPGPARVARPPVAAGGTAPDRTGQDRAPPLPPRSRTDLRVPGWRASSGRVAITPGRIRRHRRRSHRRRPFPSRSARALRMSGRGSAGTRSSRLCSDASAPARGRGVPDGRGLRRST